MKKVLCGVVLVVIAAIGALFFLPKEGASDAEYLRIHIRANSNDAVDQEVKLKVKDAVVDRLIPILAFAESKENAARLLSENGASVVSAAVEILRAEGFDYGAKCEVRREEFPTRNYGDLTLPKGAYDALIVELGAGEGDNWWCVAFPPLCFLPKSNGKNIVYKSKIVEMIQAWQQKKAVADRN